MEIKSYFKVSLKGRDGKPSIKEVSYQGADGETYIGLQFEGYASTKDMDRTNDVVVPGAFRKSIEQYMENPIIFLQHNSALPIGSVIEASIDDTGLFIKGIVKSDKENIFQDLRTGVIKTMSFGYRVNDYEQKEKKDGEKRVYYNEIKELELFEISLVSVPMNPKAKIKSKEELLGKNLNDEEYAKYFQINKDEEYTLFKSISDVMAKFEEKGHKEDTEIKSFEDLKQKSFEVNMEMKTLDIDCEIKKLDVPELYKNKIPLGAIYFEGIVSDETVNRYGEKVKSSAFVGQIQKFLKNGVVLNSHDSSQPIGLPLWVNINKNNQVEVGGYVFDEYTENRVSKGLYRGLSIGFIPTERVWEDKETGEEKTHKEFIKMLNECETFEERINLINKYMFVITKLDWLEYSFVTTPANKGTTIKLNYIEGEKEYIDKYKEMPVTTTDEIENKEEEKEEVETISEEEKMQIESVVEIDNTPKKEEEKEEEKEEVKTEEVEEVVEEIEKEEEKKEEVETPEVKEEEKETIETPEIPENNGGDAIDTPKETEDTPENEVPEVKDDVLEEKVDKIEKSFTKSIDEISNRFKNVEGLDVFVKELKNTMETSIKELKSEQVSFKKEVEEVVNGCIDIVNVLAKNFKNFCVDSGLQFSEAQETMKEKKEKKLLETPLAVTLKNIKQ